MDELQIGDQVLGAEGSYSSVYSFGHVHASQKTEFIQIRTSLKEQPLEVTGSHLLYVSNNATKQIHLLPAEQVKRGDFLVSAEQGSPTLVAVTSIGSVKRAGIYAPFLHSGNLLVNGMLASSYIALPQKFQRQLSYDQQHWLQHCAYAPYRLYCWAVGCKQESRDISGISVGVSMWLPLLDWLEEHDSILPGLSYAAIVCQLSLWLFEQITDNAFQIGAALLGIFFLSKRYAGDMEQKKL